MAKLFLDTNILLDIVLVREDYEQAEKMMDLATDELMDVVTSESSLANTIYSAPKAIDKIILLLRTCKIISADTITLIRALESGFKDKEDAIQYYVAMHNTCDYFITRNLADFHPYASAALPAMTPQQFNDHIKPPSEVL